LVFEALIFDAIYLISLDFSIHIGGVGASKKACFTGLSGGKYRMCSIVLKYAYFMKMERIN